MDDDGLQLFTDKHNKYYRQGEPAISVDPLAKEENNSLNTDSAQIINAKGRFFDRTLPVGTILKKVSTTYNYTFFIMSGSVHLEAIYACDNSHIEAGQFFIISCDQEFEMTMEKEVHLIIFKFISVVHHFNIPFFQNLDKLKTGPYVFTTLPINSNLDIMLKFISHGLNSNLECYYFHRYCHGIYSMILRDTYSLEDNMKIHYNIIGKNLSFRRKILQNYPKAYNVNELASIVGMSKTTFFKNFSEEFGMNAKEWLVQKKKDFIIMNLADPTVTVKMLMFRSGFDTPSNFTRFFHQNFHCTPSYAVKNRDKFAPQIHFEAPVSQKNKEERIIIINV